MSAQGPICRDCKAPMSLVEMQDEDIVLAGGDIGMESWVEVWKCCHCPLRLQRKQRLLWYDGSKMVIE